MKHFLLVSVAYLLRINTWQSICETVSLKDYRIGCNNCKLNHNTVVLSILILKSCDVFVLFYRKSQECACSSLSSG